MRTRLKWLDATEKSFWVYITASGRNGTLYIGVTSDLVKRIWQHKNKIFEGFTTEYGIDQLMWFEQHSNAEAAITREKQLKKWRRAWKIELIQATNPGWQDLYDSICG
jgi:putative endonuclease